MNIKQLENKLSDSLEYLKNCTDESEANTVVYQSLSLCDEILELDSDNVTALTNRMNLNLHPSINNVSKYITDAEILATNPAFEPDLRMYGYECMIYAYDELLGMPQQAIKITEDQLIDIQGLFTKQFEKDGAEARALNTLGNLHFNQENKEEALKLWSKSFDKDPFVFQRNQTAGYQHLLAENWSEATRFLTKYYKYCYNYEDDGFRVALGKELERFLKAGKLDNEPTLIALYYHIVRNEEASFGITSTSSFIENYFQDLLAWGEKYPQSSLLWAAIGNTYFFIDNHIKAIDAYTKVLEGDAPFGILVLDRLHTSCEDMNTDFFAMPMPKGGFSAELYGVATQYLEFYNAGEKDNVEPKILNKYLDRALSYASTAYEQFKSYIIDETNHDTINNYPHVFAMLCNNYGIIMEYNARNKNYGELSEEDAKTKYQIHWNGYQISPFEENLNACVESAYRAELYDECIERSYEYEKTYFDYINVDDRQQILWFRASSFSKLENKHAGLKETFEKSKKIYQTLGKGVEFSTYKFTYIAKFYFRIFKNDKMYEQLLPDLLWFLEEEIASEIPEEVGLFHHYATLCYEAAEDWEKALHHHKKTVEWIEKSDNDDEDDFYWDTMQEAKASIKRINKKLGKSSSKGKGFFGKLFDF